MDSNSASLVNIYRFPTGRRLHAVREVGRRALAMVVDDIAAHAQTAVKHDARVAAMEARAEAGNRNLYGPEASAMDNRVDRATAGIESYLEAQERVFGGASQRGSDAAFLRRELFPRGAGAITRLPYVREHERINALLERSREASVAEAVARIPELPAMLAELEGINVQYGTALGDYDRERPSPDELAAAQARGQELLAEVVAMILARYALQPDKRDEREALLEPILRQQEAIRAARLGRRKPRDIDPDTGEELPGPDVPLPEPDIGDGTGSEPQASA